MKKTEWDLCPEMKTSSMLFAPTLEQHYEIFKNCFDNQDCILDVGCGNGDFSKFITNSVGVDENTDLFLYDFTNFNTLHFSESIGYLSEQIISHLFLQPSIKKIVIKDFLYQNPAFLDTVYWSYDLRTLYRIALPILRRHNFKMVYTPFIPNRDRWHSIVKKYNLNMDEVTGSKYREVQNILVIAKR